MKRLLIGLFNLALLFLPLTATALQYGDFTYMTNASAVTITGYTGAGGVVTIPDTIDSLPVRMIGNMAFRFSGLSSVTIPGNVRDIGDSVFSFCSLLTNATIATGVTNIATGAFSHCTRLTSVTIPSSVTSIGVAAFSECNLTNVTIPSSVVTIRDGAFSACTNLTAITVDPSNAAYCSLDGILFTKSQTWLIQCPAGKVISNYIIPGGTAAIRSGAFSSCRSLTSVTIPSTVTSIGTVPFQECTRLTALYFTGNAPLLAVPQSLGGYGTVYYRMGTTGWTNPWGNRPTAIWPEVTVTLSANPSEGGSVTGGGTYWMGTNVSLTATPASGWWFSGWGDGQTNNPYSLNVPGTNVSLTAYFSDTAPQYGWTVTNGLLTLTGYTGSGGAMSVPGAINGLPVAGIGFGLFANRADLNRIFIPAGITSIGDQAFFNCPNLTAVYFLGNAPSVSANSFSSGTTVYYLPGTTGWGTTYGGVLAVCWNPQAQALEMPANQFGFTITGNSNVNIIVEACTNLANPVWVPITTNTLTGDAFYFSDPSTTNHLGRFYRFRAP